MIDLNKIPKKVLFATNLFVILLLVAAIFLFFIEIYYIKRHGGECINNPMAWAEKYAQEEKNIIVDCSCRQLGNFYIPELNITED